MEKDTTISRRKNATNARMNTGDTTIAQIKNDRNNGSKKTFIFEANISYEYCDCI
jgi:hypothetical protein